MNNIRKARRAKNISMKELGKIVGVSEGAISHYELGQRQASYEMLLKIGEALDVSVSYLLGVEEPRLTGGTSPEKQAILDAVDGMSAEQLQKLLKIIEAIK